MRRDLDGRGQSAWVGAVTQHSPSLAGKNGALPLTPRKPGLSGEGRRKQQKRVMERFKKP